LRRHPFPFLWKKCWNVLASNQWLATAKTLIPLPLEEVLECVGIKPMACHSEDTHSPSSERNAGMYWHRINGLPLRRHPFPFLWKGCP
ncbi:MAG: hypothetical protein MJZ49_08845, partial [Bacteroidales bacterium]|nr:hypothetical protein [Bacteroidales bacterium]